MSTAAGRKKAVVSNAGLQIDTPVAHNTLLNKAASQSTSLYQQCSSLRSRLLRIRGFAPFFTLASHSDSRQSTDPVTQLWDLFALGISLCFIFNLLHYDNKITAIDTDPDLFDASDERAKKRAIILFAMQIKLVAGFEPIIVTDLWDRNSTDGLVKVRHRYSQLMCIPSCGYCCHRLSILSLPLSTNFPNPLSKNLPLLPAHIPYLIHQIHSSLTAQRPHYR
jgi:cell division control protein 24